MIPYGVFNSEMMGDALILPVPNSWLIADHNFLGLEPALITWFLKALALAFEIIILTFNAVEQYKSFQDLLDGETS